MNREKLIEEVKNEYAAIASDANRQHFLQSTAEITPDAYYEKLLSAVIAEISKGTFDDCRFGSEVINIVSADKSVLSDFK